MRKQLAVLAIAAAAVLGGASGASAEVLYPWCVQYPGGAQGIGATVCSFTSLEQCRATASGMSAMCVQNPAYPDEPPRRPRARRHPVR